MLRRNAEKLELLHIPGWECKNCVAILENSLAVLQNVKHRLSTRPSSSTPRHIPIGTEKICPCKYLYINVHSSIIFKARN